MTTPLNIQNLRRSPSISRKDFHSIAAKMMGKRGVTDSVKKELDAAGVFYSGEKIKKREFSKKIKTFSEHLKEKGVKTSYFGRKVIQSVRKGETERLAKGGVAENLFNKTVKQQLSANQSTGSFRDMDPGERRVLLHKFIERGRISKDDRALLSDEGYKQLKDTAQRIAGINQGRLQMEREKELKNGGGKDEPQTSIASHKDDSVKNAENKTGNPPAKKASAPVPLQGGIRTSQSPENLESLIDKEIFAPVLESDANKPLGAENKKTNDPPPGPANLPKEKTEPGEPSDMVID